MSIRTFHSLIVSTSTHTPNAIFPTRTRFCSIQHFCCFLKNEFVLIEFSSSRLLYRLLNLFMHDKFRIIHTLQLHLMILVSDSGAISLSVMIGVSTPSTFFHPQSVGFSSKPSRRDQDITW